MKKLLIIYLIISFLMVFVYAIFVVNAYVSIKYEVETIDNDAIINMVYQIFDIRKISQLLELVYADDNPDALFLCQQLRQLENRHLITLLWHKL